MFCIFSKADTCYAGVTWLLSSQVVRMSESVWLEQLEAYSQHVASPGQQIAAEHIRMTNWLLHQQGLHALGKCSVVQTSMLAVALCLSQL